MNETLEQRVEALERRLAAVDGKAPLRPVRLSVEEGVLRQWWARPWQPVSGGVLTEHADRIQRLEQQIPTLWRLDGSVQSLWRWFREHEQRVLKALRQCQEEDQEAS